MTASASQRGSAAVVVVTHDTCDDALACLATLADAGAGEVVVVDSGSRDGTAAAIRTRHPDVEVVVLDNVGFGQGAHAGIARTTAPVVVVCNADIRFTPGAVDRLAAVFDHDGTVGAVGPLVRYPTGTRQASARRLPTAGQAVAHAALGRVWRSNPWSRAYRLPDLDVDQPAEVDWLSGCVLGLRRDAYDAVGGFDPAYFMYVEDVDLCTRLAAAGWAVRFEPAVTVVHRVGASTSRRPLRMLVEHAKSLDRFAHRHYTGRRAWLRPLLRLGLASWVGASYVSHLARTGGQRAGTRPERPA